MRAPPQPYVNLRGNDPFSGSVVTGDSLLLGFYFRLSQAARICGYRHWMANGEKRASFGMVYSGFGDGGIPTVINWLGMAGKSQVDKPNSADGWHNYYSRPWGTLAADTDYLFLSHWGSGSTKTISGGLDHDFTVGIITALGFSDHTNGGGAFSSFIQVEPQAPTQGPNLYGVDMILLPIDS